MYNYFVEYNETIADMYDLRARAKAGFYGHLIGFAVISILIIIFYLLTSLATGQLYFFLPLLVIPIWAILLCVHFTTGFFMKNK
jgi:hypothetical protein